MILNEFKGLALFSKRENSDEGLLDILRSEGLTALETLETE